MARTVAKEEWLLGRGFQLLLPQPVMSERDLIENFHLVLPLLKEQRAKVEGLDD